MQNKKVTFIALAAVLLTVGALWFTNRAVTPKEATWDDVLAEAKAGSYQIITAEELAERYQNDAKSLLLVDTRQEWEYRTGHLLGAVNFPMEPTRHHRGHPADGRLLHRRRVPHPACRPPSPIGWKRGWG